MDRVDGSPVTGSKTTQNCLVPFQNNCLLPFTEMGKNMGIPLWSFVNWWFMCDARGGENIMWKFLKIKGYRNPGYVESNPLWMMFREFTNNYIFYNAYYMKY